MITKSAFKDHALFALLALAALLVLFFPAWTGAGMLYSGDFTGSDGLDLNLPLKVNLGESLRHGTLPIWTPDLFCGYPLLGEGQTGIFYPPSLLFSLLPPVWCFNGFIFFHFMLAALGAFSYARHRGLSWHSAAFTALTFGFCSFFVLHMRHLNLLAAAAWMPLLILYVEKQTESRRAIDILPWALVLSLQWLCGHPAITYLGLFVAACLYGVAWIGDIRKGKEPSRFYLLPLSFAAGALLSGCLASLQLLPTLELIPQTKRAAISYEALRLYPFKPLHLLHLIAPFFPGNPARGTYPLESLQRDGVFWENCMYIGIVPLILALFSLFFWHRDRRVAVFFAMFVFAVLLALGPATPLFALLWKCVPGFHLFRFPSRFLLFALLALSMMAGIGWEHLASLIKQETIRKAAALLLMVLLTLNLLWFVRNYITTVPSSWLSKPFSASLLPGGGEYYRMYTYASHYSWQKAYIDDRGWMGGKEQLNRYRSLLAPDYSLLFRLPQSGEKTYLEGGMAPRCRALLEEELEKRALAAFNGTYAVLPDEVVRVLSLMNVRYVYSDFMLAHRSLKKLSRDERLEGVKVYRLDSTMPRAYIACAAVTAGSPEESVGKLFSPSFRPEQEVIVEEPVALPRSPSCGATAEVTLYTPSKVIIDANAASDGILVLSDTWYPGWVARVDGIKVPILRVNAAFRGVRMSRGAHTVTFTYEPFSFKAGLILSLLSLLAVAAVYKWRS